jgi:hypothetical protein
VVRKVVSKKVVVVVRGPGPPPARAPADRAHDGRTHEDPDRDGYGQDQDANA